MGIFDLITGAGKNGKTNFDLLHDVPLVPVASLDDPAAATPVLSHTLWADQPALIVLIRRPGCLLCRQEAHILAGKRDLIAQQYGIRMVAIVNQEFGAKDFVDNFWGRGEAYFDKELGLFKAMGDGQVRKASMLQLAYPSVIARYQQAKKSGLDSNFQGDGLMLGGLLVMRPGKGGIDYEYSETEFGDIAPIEDVLAACQRVAVPTREATAAEAEDAAPAATEPAAEVNATA
ncbi:hypothetical protein H9P43_001702 [Blastocladiella emersonii ATCC 22665]|nr:hypothetical protein H9P43_001702 [Blastocladiella emersonii ATCC 22665]